MTITAYSSGILSYKGGTPASGQKVANGQTIATISSGGTQDSPAVINYQAEQQEQSEVVAFKLSAEALYNKTKQLHEMSLNYINFINFKNNSGFLIKSLGEGQISLTEYILELAYYYEVITKAIDAERDFRLSMAILRSYQR